MSDPEGSAIRLFESTFGRPPAVVASAPGRVNLIGEHTDYNGGEVLPIAIELRTWVAVGSGASSVHRAVTTRESGVETFGAAEALPAGRWWDYVAGVARALGERGVRVPTFDIAVASDVPGGAGLSSSAALQVATTAALLALTGDTLSPREIGLVGHEAENRYVGVQSGVMDQFASALCRPGHALHLHCASMEADHVPFPEAVLIFDTRVPRSLRGSAFNTRREECEAALAALRRVHPSLPNLAAATPEQVAAADLPSPLRERALHVTRETRRVGEAVRALRDHGALPGELLLASHASLRDLFACSTPELDWFVDRAAGFPGLGGARLTGAGWGGCAIATGTPEALAEANASLGRDYRSRFGVEPARWITRAAAGVLIRSSHS